LSVLTVPTMSGPIARLEPLGLAHVDGLAAASAEDRSSYAYTWVPAGIAEAEDFVTEAITASMTGRQVPFAVCDHSGRVVGTTRFLDLDVFVWPPPPPAGSAVGPPPSDSTPPTVGEIGGTWYAHSAQGTGLNLDCKRLLLGYAFETWRVIRVTLKTDARNRRSRAAIEKIGAGFEGVRRAHTPAIDGTVRDSAYFSIVADEWPERRARLDEMISERVRQP
jgi:RimJ/RimL family protein N-acetyltransferase